MALQGNHERILDVGCGPYKVQDAIGIDHTFWPAVDAVYDLDRPPLAVRCEHI